jgi:hypothetical protein
VSADTVELAYRKPNVLGRHLETFHLTAISGTTLREGQRPAPMSSRTRSARVASGGHRGPCLDRLKGGHSSGGPHRHARRDWHRQHRHRRHTTTRCGGRIRREFFATFGNKARPRPAVVARWGGQRRPEWLSKQSSAARSARGALVKRLRIRTVIGVQFWSAQLTRCQIGVQI